MTQQDYEELDSNTLKDILRGFDSRFNELSHEEHLRREQLQDILDERSEEDRQELTADERQKLASLLATIEQETYLYQGYKHISGGYAVCELFGYDDDTIDIELKHGIEGEYHYTEQLEIDRATMCVRGG